MDWNIAEKELDKKRKVSLHGGGEEKIINQHKRNKLTARERLHLLFDEGTFVEINNLFGMCSHSLNMEKEYIDGNGVINGNVEIDGKIVYA